MISPRLSKVVSGTRLTTDLLNSMIKRTEYAADLLQQYKLVAGNQMYIEPHSDGTRVSYLQPVGGGTVPLQPIAASIKYRLSGSSFLNSQKQVFSYDGNNFKRFSIPNANNNEQIGLDIEKEKVCGYFFNALATPTRFDPFLLDTNTGIFDYPRPQPFKPLPVDVPDDFDCFFHGISNDVVVGLSTDWFYGFVGTIYQNGSLLRIQYPLSPEQEPSTYSESNNTIFFGVYENTVVGSLGGLTGSQRGLIYNLATNSYQVVNPPPGRPGLEFFGVYEDIICGKFTGSSNGFLYQNGTFTIFPDAPFKINSRYFSFRDQSTNIYDYINSENIAIADTQNPSGSLGISGIDKTIDTP